MIGVGIQDGFTHHTAKVSDRNQLVVAPLDFSTFYTETLDVNNQGYTIVPPLTGKQFVITDIVLAADRSVGANGSVVDIYEALDDDSATITTQIYKDDLAKQTRVTLTGLNIIVTEGRWVCGKCDDDNVLANIAGYYVKADSRIHVTT